MTATAFLERLSRVRSTGPGRWLACCPAPTPAANDTDQTGAA
jgi:hypothetical protein